MNNKKKEPQAVIVWAKRLSLSLAGLLLSIIVLIGGALLIMDDDDYRRLLIWEAEKFLDATLEINGQFSLSLGREVSLTAGEVRLAAHDGSYTLTVNEIDLRQRLGSWLLTGTFWINYLSLSDTQLHARQGEDSDFNLDELTLPPVVIQEARLSNVHFIFEEHGDGEKHEVALLELEMDDINNTGPVGIRGAGLVNGRNFAIDGHLGSLAGLTDTSQPYPLKLDIESGNLELHVNGSVADPVRGKGLDLLLVLDDPSVSDTLKLFDKTTPEIGRLKIQTRVSGDYDAPSLSDIDIRLQRASEVDINITGKVDNLMTGAGLALEINGQSSDPQVLSWLLFEKEDKIASFTLKGNVAEQDGRFVLNNVNVDGKTQLGQEIRLTGSAQIPTRSQPRPRTGPGLELSIRSPTLHALNLPEFGKLPEFGRVTASSRYWPYFDGAEFADIRLEAGSSDSVRATVAGKIGFIPYKYNTGLSGIDLNVHLDAADSNKLGKAINYELPALGAVRLDMHVNGSTDELLIDTIKLETGPAEQPVIRANGNVKTRLRAHTSTLEINFDAAAADLVAFYREVPTGYLGRIEGKLSLSDIDSEWRLDNFKLVSTQTTLYKIDLSGTLDDVVKRDKAEINVLIEIPDPVAFGEAADINLAGISPYRIEGLVSFKDKNIHYRGSSSIGKTQSQTKLTGTMHGDRPGLKGNLVIPVLYLSDLGVPPEAGTETEVADAARLASTPKKTKRKPHAFSRDPVNLDLLKLLDLDLDVSIDNIDSNGESAARKLKGKLVLKDSVLHIAPLHLVAEGGPTDVELRIDARDVPDIAFKISADDQKLGPWLAQVQGEVPVDGFANYKIDLHTRGHSPHDMASNLDGSFSVAFENARIPKRYVVFLSVDVFGWVAGHAGLTEKYANLDCILADFDINDGIAQSTLLAADGPRIAIEGNLKLDLGKEQIEAVFLPKQKRKLFASVSPVHLSGDMRDPDVRAIPAREAAKNIGALVLVPYVAIPAALFGKLWDSIDDGDEHGGGCANLHEEKLAEVNKAREAREANANDSEE